MPFHDRFIKNKDTDLYRGLRFYCSITVCNHKTFHTLQDFLLLSWCQQRPLVFRKSQFNFTFIIVEKHFLSLDGLALMTLNVVKQTCSKPHKLSYQTKHAREKNSDSSFFSPPRKQLLFHEHNIYNNIPEPENILKPKPHFQVVLKTGIFQLQGFNWPRMIVSVIPHKNHCRPILCK